MISEIYENKIKTLEYPKRAVKPERARYANNATYGAAVDKWEVAEQEFRTKRTEYNMQVGLIEQQFKTALLKELGLTGHPKAEKLYAMAWEKGHSSGFGEVELIAGELAELLK